MPPAASFVYELLASESRFLSESAKAELPELGTNLCIIYSALSAKAIESNEKMWKMMPKLHLFDHLCGWQAVEAGNPRFYWTYADEDLVGLLCECAQSCHVRALAPFGALQVAACILLVSELLGFASDDKN